MSQKANMKKLFILNIGELFLKIVKIFSDSFILRKTHTQLVFSGVQKEWYMIVFNYVLY